MKKIEFYTLSLEVTRRCNLKCRHCLRGEAQNKNMSEEVIDKILDQTDFICRVTFSGGEPSLNVDIIRYFVKKVKELKIPVYGFCVVTNGKKYSQELVDVLDELYEYCCECDTRDVPEYRILTVSRTQFHEGVSDDAYEKYAKLKYFDDDKNKHIPERDLLNEGMARKNGIGVWDLKYNSIEVYYENNKICIEDGAFYVNVNGDVLTGCDYSYESQEKYKAGNVFENTLEDIICSNKIQKYENFI